MKKFCSTDKKSIKIFVTRFMLIISAIGAALFMTACELIAIPPTIKLHLWHSLKAEWKACAREDWHG